MDHTISTDTDRRRAAKPLVCALAAALVALLAGSGEGLAQQQILSGPLAKLDIKKAEIAPSRGKSEGTLTVAQHFALDPGWLNPLTHSYAVTQQHYDYLVHDALIKPMPQGEMTYSLAEHAEMAADFKKAAFRLRPGLKFHDGTPLTAADVKWTYENFKGANFKQYQEKIDRIEVADDRTVIFHFKEPFVDFIDMYNGVVSGIGWVVPRQYYEKVGADEFKQKPIGAGPYRLVSQEAGTQMVFEAWADYWRQVPATKTIIVKGIRDPASRLAGLQTGELDLAYGLTGKLLPRLMADKNLRFDPNYTAPWFLIFPGYNEPSSPFHDKRVREAVSLSINRAFLSKQETQGIGKPWGNWLSAELRDALPGDKMVPEYNPEKAKKLLAEAGFPNGFDFEWYVPFVPYFDMGQRILADLRAVGIRSKLEVLEGPAFRSKIGQGRKGFPGNSTIVQNIDPKPGGAAVNIAVYAVCSGTASFICEPKIEELWKKHRASTDPEERDSLVASIQKIILDEYYFVPIYLNSFVAAVGPRVLPEGDGFRKYWETKHAPYPWPWEIWQVKSGG